MPPCAPTAAQCPRGFVDGLGVQGSVVRTTQSVAAAAITQPVSIFAACHTPESGWGFETRVAFGDHRESYAGRMINFGVGLGLSRHLGDISERNPAFGPSITGGVTLSLVAPTSHAFATRVVGLTGGIGTRIGLGDFVAIRPELAVEHDFAAEGGAGSIPSATRLAFRLGISAIDNPRAP